MVSVAHLGGGVGKRGFPFVLATSVTIEGDYQYTLGVVETCWSARGTEGTRQIFFITRQLLSAEHPEPLPFDEFSRIARLGAFAHLTSGYTARRPRNVEEHREIIKRAFEQVVLPAA